MLWARRLSNCGSAAIWCSVLTRVYYRGESRGVQLGVILPERGELKKNPQHFNRKAAVKECFNAVFRPLRRPEPIIGVMSPKYGSVRSAY